MNTKLKPSEIVAKYRVSMNEESPNDMPFKRLGSYDIFQLKYDGWWVAVQIEGKYMSIITSGAEVRKIVEIDNPDNIEALLLGEWMYGTNWSQTFKPGKVLLHDIVYWKDETDFVFDGEKVRYSERLNALKYYKQFFPKFGNEMLEVVETYFIATLQEIWDQTPTFEGVVLKDTNSLLLATKACKIKREYTADYVVMGIAEGGGRLTGKMGAINGGQYEYPGKLVPVCSIGGGFTDAMRKEIWENRLDYMGKVFEAKGKGLFKGGALRHPVFSRWREDKLPEQCVRKT